MDKIKTLLLRRAKLCTNGIKKNAETQNGEYENGLFFHCHLVHDSSSRVTFKANLSISDVNCFLMILSPDHLIHLIPVSR
jgi:hypothetical protein